MRGVYWVDEAWRDGLEAHPTEVRRRKSGVHRRAGRAVYWGCPAGLWIGRWSGTLVQWIRLSILVMLACASGAVFGGPTDGTEDCAVVERVTLECGLEVVVFSQAGLEGDPQVWVRLHRGSMSERDEERGAALMAARAAIFGVGAFSQERMFELFDVDEAGAIAGDRVMVMGDHVAFMLEVGSGDEVGIGFELARALVDGYEPGEDAAELVRAGMIDEIDVIEREQIERELNRAWLPRLVDGSGYSRLPLASREACGGLGIDTVRGYVAREWTAGQASVLVVGDVDVDAVVAEARRVFAGCESGAGTAKSVVPVIKEGLGGRVVSVNDERLTGSRLGLVWFGEERENVWDDAGFEEVLVLALVGEAMRHRVNRLMRREFEGVEIGRCDVGELLGRIRYGQIVVELKEDSESGWEAVLGVMEMERRRLVRDGLSGDEIERAREWLIQQWGYEIDQWSGSTTQERAQVLSWMMASGRPLVDLVAWVDQAGVLLDGVDDERVNETMRELFGEHEPAVLGLIDSDEGVEESEIRAVLDKARGAELVALDINWVDDFDGPILSRSGSGGSVDEISVHQGSGVVSATLSNGVVVRHREMVDVQKPDHLVMVVRVGFDSIESYEMHGAGNVFAAAIEAGMIRSRTEKEMRGVLIEHGIELEVHAGSWGIEVWIDAPAESFERAAELIHALLTDLRIEQGLVDAVADNGASGALMVGVPIGVMEAAIGRMYGEDFIVRDTGKLGADVDARSMREWISERVRGGAIDIGIAGEIDAQRAVGACAEYFGGIRDWEIEAGEAVAEEEVIAEEILRVRDPSGRVGVMIGIGGCMVGELDEVRALTVAGMVLDGRLEAMVEEFGKSERVTSGSMVLDVVPGRMVMFGRVDCEPGESELWAGRVEDEFERMVFMGVEDEELAGPMEMIDGVLGKNFERAGFWAARLAGLGEFGDDSGLVVESIWSIREGYAAVDAAAVQRVFEKWYREGVHFRVEFVDEER